MSNLRTESFNAEVFWVFFTPLIFSLVLCFVAYSVFKPDVVEYVCPKEQLGHKLTSSTYDGKVVQCTYIKFNEDYGRGKLTKPALEIR